MRSDLLAALLGTAIVCSVSAFAQTDTTFTYQGQLNEAGSPANGSFNMEFGLFDALVGGAQVGPVITIAAQSVSDGVFSSQLDFGAQNFSGTEHWLEIVVDGNTLSPRQPMTASPFSIQTRGIFVDGSNNVGIGTVSPTARLEVATPQTAVRGESTSTSGFSSGGEFFSNSPSGTGVSGYATASTGQAYGVEGSSNSITNGRGVSGQAFGLTGQTYGVFGLSSSTSGRGVGGFSNISSGTTYGVYGQNSSTSGRAIYGLATAPTGTTYGGRFFSESTSGRAIYGEAAANTGTTYGVVGITNSPDGFAGWFSGDKSYFEGRVGIGFDDPTDKLHVLSGVGESALRVQQAGATRLRINANGGVSLGTNSTVVSAGNVFVGFNLGIGDSTPELPLDVVGDAVISGNLTLGTTSPSAFFTLSVNGSAAKSGGGSWSIFSDKRLKKNITSMTGSLDTISALRPVNFEYTAKDHFSYTPGIQSGFIAQEVQGVIPQWVNTADDGYFYLDQVGYEALIVDAIQELRAEKDEQIEQLQSENERLKARLDRIEQMLTPLSDK